ncbi:MAG: hypothetical protein CL845_06795 [Crocinitomicaceae bacterium]|nr:hypothetical protein [Crocinitomicaceae bacterium]|tara:strand:+ start:438 stop:821 length:384 start_codon:yes stop_codon:yes gene_type:complete
MAITYTWEVTGLKKTKEGDNEDAVVQTYWTKTGKDGNNNEGVFNGATPFTSANADPFIAFADLTEETVLGWIKAEADVDGSSYQEHINAQILKQINEKITPVVEADMPWVAAEESGEDPAAPADSGE